MALQPPQPGPTPRRWVIVDRLGHGVEGNTTVLDGAGTRMNCPGNGNETPRLRHPSDGLEQVFYERGQGVSQWRSCRPFPHSVWDGSCNPLHRL